MEAKSNEVRYLKEEIDSQKESLLAYRLNLHPSSKRYPSSLLDSELLALAKDNKSLRLELNDLKHKYEDLVFKSQRVQANNGGRSARDIENENK